MLGLGVQLHGSHWVGLKEAAELCAFVWVFLNSSGEESEAFPDGGKKLQ